MLLSIIVPIYNVEPYLVKCITSILNQNFSNYELILIDDKSSDNSLRLAMTFQDNEKVRIICKDENGGLSETRNLGINIAKGKYLMFIDSDDYIEENSLTMIDSILRSNNYPSVVYFGYYEESNNETKKFYGYKSKKNQLYNNLDFLANELRERNLYAAACFGIYQRDFILKNKLFFKTGLLHEDELWTPQVILNANDIYTSDYVFYHYLRRENSITKNSTNKNALDLLVICKELDMMCSEIKNSELKSLLYNHISKLYMHAIIKGNPQENSSFVNTIDRFYPLRHSYFLKDKLKAVLFALNLKLYISVVRMLKK